MSDNTELRKENYTGKLFAPRYLQQCKNESKSDDEIDIQVYAKPVQLDLNLGMTASEQLFQLFKYSLRFDLLKVSIHFINIK